MPPFVDLWGWFNEHRSRAQREDNQPLLRLVNLWKEIWDSFEPDPNHALACCNEAIDLARQLQLPCMELFYKHWRCEAYLFYLHQIDVGLRESVKLALEAQKPEYLNCPVRGRVFRVLVNAYHFNDSYGYAPEIEAVLDYMENDVPLDKDTWRLVTWERAALASGEEDYEKAYELTEVYRARSEDDKFRLIGAYSNLCWLSYKLKRFDAIGGFATAGEEYARSENRRRSLSTFLCWKAFAQHRAGEKAAAWRTAAEAIRQSSSVGAHPVHHATLTYYYEARGDLDKALKLRREVLAFEMVAGSMDGEAVARVEICKLVAKMGLPLADELALARAATAKLRRPEKTLRILDQLERGEILD